MFGSKSVWCCNYSCSLFESILKSGSPHFLGGQRCPLTKKVYSDFYIQTGRFGRGGMVFEQKQFILERLVIYTDIATNMSRLVNGGLVIPRLLSKPEVVGG